MRNRNSKNHYRINGEIVTMDLYNRQSIKIAETKFNLRHLPKLREYKWYKDNKGYVNSQNKRMHQVITEYVLSDHIDRNTLNNIDENLRPCNHMQQRCNTGKTSSVTTSRYKGVYWAKRRKKWRSQIYKNRKRFYLGNFHNEEEAALEMFGEFACLNFERAK